MAQYTERLWTQTKDTEQLTFVAGVDLPYRELVKESGPNTNIMVVATTVDAIGYVLSPKGVLAGEKVDIQMLYGSPGGGGGGGSVNSINPGVNVTITGPATDPIVNAQNIYTNNGTFTSNRTATMGGFNLFFTAAAAERIHIFNHMFRQDVNVIELGYLSSIAGNNTNVALDFRSTANAIHPDWSARIIRDAGQNGWLSFSNLGSGTIAFNPNAFASLLLLPTGQVQFFQYGLGTYTGTPAFGLAVDGAGNIIETSVSGGGAVNSVTGLAPNVIVDNTDPANPIVTAGIESWEFSGILTTPVLSSIQNNYTQAGMANITTLRVVGDVFDPPSFTGFAGGTDGRVLIIHNVGATSIFFLHNSSSSLVANRIMSPGSIVVNEDDWSLPINGMATFQYDSTSQRWRVIGNYIYDILPDGGGVISVSGGNNEVKVVGFNGVFTDGTTITGNGTVGSPLVAAPATGPLFNQTIYVDPFYGDDATAIPDSQTLKYKNIDTALSALGASFDYTIHLFPGNHIINSAYALTNELKIYMEPFSKIVTNTAGPTFSISPSARLYVRGNGEIDCQGTFAANSSPSDPIPAECHIQVKAINSSGAGSVIEPTSMIFTVEADSINDRGFQGSGWCKGNIKCDFWQTSSSKLIHLSDFTAENGETKFDNYGQQQIIVKGRNRERCLIYNAIQATDSIYTELGVEPHKTYIELNADFDSTDGFFLNPGRGTWVFNGNLVHRKTDTAGNEVPWLWHTQQILSDGTAPIFHHKSGTWISGRNVLFGGSQNNEIVSLRSFGSFTFSGSYKNSGANTGAGAWPIIQLSNQNTEGSGITNLILDGEFTNDAGSISPIQIVDTTNPTHEYKLSVKNCIITIKSVIPTISSNVPMFIYVYHSLVMSQNYDPLITDGMSEDRTMIDSNVEVIIEGYGV